MAVGKLIQFPSERKHDGYGEVSRMINDHYAALALEILTRESEWIKMFDHYRVPDTRGRWRRLWDRLKYHTVGKFRMWLHRDCE